ncbi:MAG: beta-galactosidase [Actinomyces graevenitzii]|nr:beta-galactosidase [Actinomyces graevenitzii]
MPRKLAKRAATLAAIIGMALAGGALPISVAQAASAAPPAKYATADITFPGNDGKPHKVTFDKNSFMVDGQRLNVWSGEIHYWRAPDVNSWRDLFQKMRANGYNAVSLYFFWGLHQSKEGGPFDFSKGTIKDLDLLLTMAQEEGLYVIARPGPYVNAEISMGGLPAWMTNYSGGLRTTDPKVLAASKAWLHAFNQIASKHLVTKGGGSVLLYQVENELLSDNAARGAFLKSLVGQVKADGIDVPLFHNDYGLGGRFKNTSLYGTDFYAYDKYPVGFNCSAGRNRIDDSEATFRSYAPNSPHFITESQGGAFTPWGASYNASDCYTYTDEGFTRQWGVHNIGNGVTAFNYYMAYGGTNWGWTGAPASGFTSYDYGAGITEDRTLTPKASVQKETGYYTKAVPELSSMNPVQAPSAVVESGSNVKIYARQAETGQGSVTGNGVRTYAMRLANSNDTTETTFTTTLSLGKPRGATTTGFSHDDRNSAITYTGSWSQVADSSAASGTLTRTKTVGDTASFTFTGTGVRLITATGTDHGYFKVSIDGGEAQLVTSAHVDTEQNKPTQLEAYRIENLSPGQHTIKVENVGFDGANVVDIDAFDVLGSTAAQAPIYNDSDTSFFTFTGSWQHATGKNWTQGDHSGDETFSKTAGDSYTFTFTGVGFDIIAPFSSNHGSATVTVDGQEVGQTKEDVTSEATPQQTVFSWRAEKGAAGGAAASQAAGGGANGEAAAQSGATASQNTEAATQAAGGGANGEAAAQSGANGAGTEGSAQGAEGGSQGGAQGAAAGTQGAEAGAGTDKAGAQGGSQGAEAGATASQAAKPATHTVKVTVDGKAFSGSQDTFVSLDAVKVYPNAQSLPGENNDEADGTISWKRIPQKEGTTLTLHGRDAIMLTADKQMGGHELYYTTSQMFGATLNSAGGSLQYLTGTRGDSGETVLHYTTQPQVSAPEGVEQTWDAATGQLRLNYSYSASPQQIIIKDGDKVLSLRIIDRTTAQTTWLLDGTRNGKLSSVAVEGVELARTAKFTGKDTLQLTGSVSAESNVRVIAPAGINHVGFNGGSLNPASATGSAGAAASAAKAATGTNSATGTAGASSVGAATSADATGTAGAGTNSATGTAGAAASAAKAATSTNSATGTGDVGVFTGKVPGPAAVASQQLSFVKSTDYAEAKATYDDSKWKVAADTQAANPRFQGPGEYSHTVLDSNHYGFYEGSVWYRGTFTATKADPYLYLQGNGGSGVPSQGKNPAFMQVWVNGVYAGAYDAAGNWAKVNVPAGTVKSGDKVTVAVLVNNLGQNLDWSDDGLSKQNRGLFDVAIEGSTATWKIHGADADFAAKAATNPSGTLYNNGGLGGEKAGFHMPGFDDSKWAKADNLHSQAGVTWYRAHVKLNLPANQDTAFRLDINSSRFSSLGDRAQATLFVNVWNTGVYIGDRGPQTSFTIPAGFLNPNGENVISIAVAAKEDGMGPDSVTLRAIHSTTKPALGPTPAPTGQPTVAPTAAPTTSPQPTAAPTGQPTVAPTAAPTGTAAPTPAPTASPTATATAAPTVAPTAAPTGQPSPAPTASPTGAPTGAPTANPTVAPTGTPTTPGQPTTSPQPTAGPTASSAPGQPTAGPGQPTASPTASAQPTTAPGQPGKPGAPAPDGTREPMADEQLPRTGVNLALGLGAVAALAGGLALLRRRRAL